MNGRANPNEGIRVLEDFVCLAIPNAAVLASAAVEKWSTDGIKVTRLSFPVRSSFLIPCRDVLKANRADLDTGKPVQVKLSRQGYNRQAIATIEADQSKYFWINKESEPTRFSARLRAAALALHESGCFGRYEMSHNKGLLTIRKVAGT